MLDRYRRNEGADQLDLFPEEQQDKWALRTGIAVLAVVIVALFATYAFAGDIVPPANPEGYRNDHVHAHYHQLYERMHNQNGVHCCNAGETGGDCRPTTARFNAVTGLWEAKLDGTWVDIQASRHVKDAYGLNEFAHICADPDGYLFCFIPPNNGI